MRESMNLKSLMTGKKLPKEITFDQWSESGGTAGIYARGVKNGTIKVIVNIGESNVVNNETVVLGDDVLVGKKDDKKPREGIVKIPDGPGDTVGVLVDGELEIVPADEVKVVKEDVLEEGVMGMTAMPSLARMQALAGIKPDDTAAGDQSVREDDKPEEEGPSDELVQAAEDFEKVAEVEVTMMSVPICPESEVAPESAAPEKPEITPDQMCLDAIAQIETSLPNVSVRQFSSMRKRIENIMNSLMESAEGRSRKPVDAYKIGQTVYLRAKKEGVENPPHQGTVVSQNSSYVVISNAGRRYKASKDNVTTDASESWFRKQYPDID